MKQYDSIYAVVTDREWTDGGPSPRMVIGVRYGRNGGATLRNAFSDAYLGRCNGGGYDRAGTLLADFVAKEYGVPHINGAIGESSVIRHAEEHGVLIYSMSCVLHNMPTPVERKRCLALAETGADVKVTGNLY